MSAPTADDRALVHALLDWYARVARPLPWRVDPTPYRVLLSEFMCQQTRVETALPYFERFLARWPRLEDLAAADEAEVVEAWAGLGYYRRARNLHRCARAAVARGGLPSDAEALQALPGIGPYTAGAVASIAWGRRVPLVDGNVERVLGRMLALGHDPRRSPGRRIVWDRARALHDANDGHPGDLNQALMELGATACAPRSPRCGDCPAAAWCRARALGRPEDHPPRAPRAAPREIEAVAGLLRAGDRVLLGRRRPGGLLGGLWEPIRADLDGDEPRAALEAAFAEVGLRAAPHRDLGAVLHVFTHRRLTCRVWEVRGGGEPRPGGPYDDVRFARPDEVGLSGLASRLLEAASQPPLPLAADAE